jgi:hypothetical protein
VSSDPSFFFHFNYGVTAGRLPVSAGTAVLMISMVARFRIVALCATANDQ